jgi:acyl-lipid Delta6-acetylenase / acyl-lipid (9-3)-desaturase
MPPQKGQADGGQLGPDSLDVEMVWREDVPVAQRVPKYFESTNKRRKESKRNLTMANIAKHNKRDDIWIVVEGKCYDVTKFVDYHPGGWLVLVDMGGKDCTDAFANYHPARVYEKMLPSYYIGDVVDYEETAFAKGHREIRQRLLQEGRFETNMSFYYGLGLWITCIFMAMIYFTLYRVDTISHMIGAILLALFWQQMAFIGHDIGHCSITHDFVTDNNVGIIIGNFLTGIGIGWWKRSHNVHHVVCNSIEHDPDIQHMPIMAVTENIFQNNNIYGFFSTFHERIINFDTTAKFLVSYQHYIFYPLMMVARFNLYAQGWIHILTQPQVRKREWEIIALLGFLLWLSSLIYFIPEASIGEKIAYVFLSHALAGVLHVQICLSHFSMGTYSGTAYNDDSDEWFKMQLFTTLDIDCPEWLDWFHGGLQFQIEHHLWPRLPRHELRYASKLVKEFCAKEGVHYHNPGWIEAQGELVRSMYQVALKARNSDVKNGCKTFEESQLFDGMNAQG